MDRRKVGPHEARRARRCAARRRAAPEIHYKPLCAMAWARETLAAQLGRVAAGLEEDDLGAARRGAGRPCCQPARLPRRRHAAGSCPGLGRAINDEVPGDHGHRRGGQAVEGDLDETEDEAERIEPGEAGEDRREECPHPEHGRPTGSRGDADKIGDLADGDDRRRQRSERQADRIGDLQALLAWRPPIFIAAAILHKSQRDPQT